MLNLFNLLTIKHRTSLVNYQITYSCHLTLQYSQFLKAGDNNKNLMEPSQKIHKSTAASRKTIPIQTLAIKTFRNKQQGLFSLKSSKSQQLRPRYSLPDLPVQKEKHHFPPVMQQYEFPLMKLHSAAPHPLNNDKKLKPNNKISQKPFFQVNSPKIRSHSTTEDPKLHNIIMNVILTEEIKKTIDQAPHSILQTCQKSKSTIIKKEKKKILLEKLEKEILFPQLIGQSPINCFQNTPQRLGEQIVKGFKDLQIKSKSKRKLSDLKKIKKHFNKEHDGELTGWIEDSIAEDDNFYHIS